MLHALFIYAYAHAQANGSVSVRVRKNGLKRDFNIIIAAKFSQPALDESCTLY